MKKRFAFLLINLILLLSISVSALGSELHDIGFTGQRTDDSIGLISFPYRSYDPNAGRFLQRDPSGYTDGVSLYEYVSGNVLGNVDSFGLEGLPGPIDDIIIKGWRMAGDMKVDDFISTLRNNHEIGPKIVHMSREQILSIINSDEVAGMTGLGRVLDIRDIRDLGRDVDTPRISPSRSIIPPYREVLPDLKPGIVHSAEALISGHKDYTDQVGRFIYFQKGQTGAMIRIHFGKAFEEYMDFSFLILPNVAASWGKRRRILGKPKHFFYSWQFRTLKASKARAYTGIEDYVVAENVAQTTRRRLKKSPGRTWVEVLEEVKSTLNPETGLQKGYWGRKYSPQRRAEVINYLINTNPSTEAAASYFDIPVRTIQGWKKAAGLTRPRRP